MTSGRCAPGLPGRLSGLPVLRWRPQQCRLAITHAHLGDLYPGGGPSVEAVCRGRSRGCAPPRLPGICGGQLSVRPRVRGQQRGRV